MASEPLDLDAIEARANKATPGPWVQNDDFFGLRRRGVPMTCAPGDSTEEGEDNAIFIVAARTDVPALVQRVRDLVDRVAALETERDAWSKALQRCTPGGSEFLTPQACEEWVLHVGVKTRKALVSCGKAKRELEAQIAILFLAAAVRDYLEAGARDISTFDKPTIDAMKELAR